MNSLDADLVAGWTAKQRRQASLAVFRDSSDLSFAVPAVPARALPPLYPDAPPVYREELNELHFEGLEVVAGLDISFRDGSGDEGIAVLAVLSFPSLKLLRTLSRRVSLSSTPYIHSFLSFRESDIYISLLDELRATGGPEVQVLFVDGNGRWHPREAGSAVAVGVKSGLPTVGIAKEYHPLHPSSSSSSADPATNSALPAPFPSNYLSSQKSMRKACHALLQHRGDWFGLRPPEPGGDASPRPSANSSAASQRRDDYWGAALLSSPSRSARNPIIVSPGHRLSLQTCVKLALACTGEGKVPEPVRQADLVGRELVRQTWPKETAVNEHKA
ncbi:hypothetical protein NBRC10513v2_003534 [Rhodotorula toruloides]|uniref:BY PROTMAP: gi/472583262/gb/EMS20905.1/ deoxyribonuclease V [Rhodosporidium toruloides NP11] gi/647401821/emb/CDR48176.1/ RHTO0S16e02872g1_1 [Rhodosporidium toruloides] n=1 Tax=Rhodotorula toruloides TaxID=5286 RepID=A0A0K3C967_RHOTO|nr:hypothetical protein AAT19DRAFT_12146 [Rhodotorula toruloides]